MVLKWFYLNLFKRYDLISATFKKKNCNNEISKTAFYLFNRVMYEFLNAPIYFCWSIWELDEITVNIDTSCNISSIHCFLSFTRFKHLSYSKKFQIIITLNFSTFICLISSRFVLARLTRNNLQIREAE